MKVMCINDTIHEMTGNKFMPKLRIGETYTVVDETEYRGHFFYLLLEFIDPNFKYWYEKEQFIPLSNIDETELIKERELVTF